MKSIFRYVWDRRHRVQGKRFRVLANTGINYIENWFKKEHMLSEPYAVQIEPTLRCNLLCKQCFRQDPASKRKSGDLSFENFEKIIGQFKNVLGVHLIGLGESFLNKDLPKMIDLLGERNIDVFLTTNGTIASDEIMAAINRGEHVRIQFSIDAACAETYHKIRGVDLFDTVMEHAGEFVKQKGPGVFVSTSMVVMKENIDELSDFVLMADRLGIERIHLGDLGGTWLGDDQEDLVVRELDDLRQKVEAASSLAKEKGIDLRYNRYSHVWGDEAEQARCWYVWQCPYITYDGFVASCCALPNPDMHNFGNVFETPFPEIWNGEEYRSFRKMLKQGNPHELCKPCHLAG